MKTKRTVDSFLGTGVNTPIGKYEISEHGSGIAIGTLLAFNNNGQLVSAEGVEDKRVVGVITEGSPVVATDPRYMPNGKNVKDVGDYQELYREFKLMGVTDIENEAGVITNGKWEKKHIGTVVYLSKGKLTVKRPTAGTKGQKIGVLGDPARKEILVSLKEDVITY